MGEIGIRDCRHGRFMYYQNDYFIGGSLEKYGEYSEGEIALWKQVFQPGMIVADIGANIGMFTVWMSKAVGPTGRVYAVEPQRRIYQMLVGNLALNEITNTFVMNGALGSRDGVLTVPIVDYDKPGHANFGGVSLAGDSTTPTEGSGESVPVTKLDSIPGPFHFLKIDVEGMELDVLKGAEEVLKRDKPILYVENDRQDKQKELIEWLLAADYRLFWHLPPLFTPKNFRQCLDNIFGAVVSINMFCIPAARPATITGLPEILAEGDSK